MKLGIENRNEIDRIGRSPRGERGLKCHCAVNQVMLLGRSPRGERGLKSRKARILPSEERVALREGSVD